ncbi:unnamed protein product, partial [Polarella glacialis]
AAMTIFRGALRQVPPSMLRSPAAVEAVMKPVANFVGWPSMVLPTGVSVLPDRISDLPGEWLLPPGYPLKVPREADRLLLWAHGGGFAFCSPGTHRLFLAK